MVKEGFVCPRCGNSERRYIAFRNGAPYCRRCISFNGTKASSSSLPPVRPKLSLSYSLSKEQSELSKQIVSNYENGIDTLVYAVCGAGKTELSYGVIKRALEKKQKVGFALPRRDVVIELVDRIKEAFPNNKVVAVYGGNTSVLDGDIIVLTTHQLYRYPSYFDLMVMDEIDAFPFRGNDVLSSFFKQSIKGHYVMMTATPSKSIIDEFSKDRKAIVELRTRFHKHIIPVPSVRKVPGTFWAIEVLRQLKRFIRDGKPCLVFAPTIDECVSLYRKISPFCPGGQFVHSKREERSSIIEEFKRGKYKYLVTTSVLERGVTVKDLQVIIYHADREDIYDEATLIQISGRVGRKKDAPKGEIIYICEKQTRSMEKSIKEITYCNTFLQSVL